MQWKNKRYAQRGGAALLIVLAGTMAHAGLFHHKKAVPTEPPAADPASAPIVSSPPASPDAAAQYDDVGYAQAGQGAGVFITHAQLPAASFVELTNLDTGKTILAAVRETAPTGRAIALLSPRAVALLGAADGAPLALRVRRVNPPDQEKAMLMNGDAAAERLDTPPMLLAALRRKLAGVQGMPVSAMAATTPLPAATPPATMTAAPKPKPKTLIARPGGAAHVKAAPVDAPQDPSARFVVEGVGASPVPRPPAPAPMATRAPRAPAVGPAPVRATRDSESPADDVAPAAASKDAGFSIQVVSLSSEAHAREAAKRIGKGAHVVAAGPHWHVVMGPFQTEGQARAQLGGLAAKGYRGVRIIHD